MAVRTVAVILSLAVVSSASRLAPKTNSLLPEQALIPAWACALNADHDSPVLASGDAKNDRAEAVAMLSAARKIAKEEGLESQQYANQSESLGQIAESKAKRAEGLRAKAEVELKSHPEDAERDSKEAVEIAQAAAKDSEDSGVLARDANATEKVAEMDASQMFLAASKMKKIADEEDMLAVRSVDGSQLTSLLGQEDLIIVFYAPWCKHCQEFVQLQDAHDDMGRAPIELLNRDLKQAGGPRVVKFNVDAHKDIPSSFNVKFIPAVYLATTSPFQRAQFDGEPSDFAAVRDFVSKRNAMKSVLH